MRTCLESVQQQTHTSWTTQIPQRYNFIEMTDGLPHHAQPRKKSMEQNLVRVSSLFVKEMDAEWKKSIKNDFLFFLHVAIEFKIKLSFLVCFLCSLLGQCGNEENWFSCFLLFILLFWYKLENKHIYKGQLELPMEQRLRNKTLCFGKSSVFQKHHQQYSKISFAHCAIKNFMM